MKGKINKMGTNNFSYSNRCVIVPEGINDDYDDSDFIAGDINTTQLVKLLNTSEQVSIRRSSSRSYPSYVLRVDLFNSDNDQLILHRIVLTLGYYCAACIDYIDWDIENEFSIINIKDNIDYLFTHHILNSINEAVEENSSIEEMRDYVLSILMEEYERILRDTTEFENKLRINIEELLTKESLKDYKQSKIASNELRELCHTYVTEINNNEINFCNDYIDKLKEEFGFEEYGCIAVASNGEASYEKITQ